MKEQTANITLEEQSSILNKQLLEMLQSNPHPSYSLPSNPNLLSTIITNFKASCSDSDAIMDYMTFRKMLGLLGTQDSFISRIFHLIDDDNDGVIDADDYSKYMMKVLYGTQDQKAYNAWCILKGKNQRKDAGIQLKDFTELFQEMIQVWNSITGEVIPINKKYIQELFNIFDLDEDHLITFPDYRIFFHHQPYLFGWFEYLNAINLDQSQSSYYLSELRNNLTQFQSSPTIEAISTQLNQQQHHLADGMSSTFTTLSHLEDECKVYSHSLDHIPQSLQSTQSQVSSIKNHQYNILKLNTTHITNNYDIAKIKSRNKLIHHQSKAELSISLIRELQLFLQLIESQIISCETHRELQDSLTQYSPIKIRERQTKQHVVRQKVSNVGNPSPPNQSLIYFGHPNWNLAINLMVGLRKSIRALYQPNLHLDIKDSHFDESHQFLLGNKVTNGSHFSLYYKFSEKAPLVFERMRHNFGLTNIEYQRSVGPERLLNHLLTGNLTAINEKCSNGKSGSFFYLTLDNKIYLKTIPLREYAFFSSIIKDYYKHMMKHENTLIVRIYGLYKLKVYRAKEKIQTIYLISMENIFHSINPNNIFHNLPHQPSPQFQIKQVYDLKGSLYGRTGVEGKQLKDNDWVEKNKRLNISLKEKLIFQEQIKIDSKFFKNNNINDYSLLIAIVHCQHPIQNHYNSTQNIFKRFHGGIKSIEDNCFYIISIIDILTVFETRKNLEYIFKSTFLSKDVSCIPPKQYCQRFRKFMFERVLRQEDTYESV